MTRTAVALSGGVDSSVAAALLLRNGMDVLGIFMRHAWQKPVANDVPLPDGLDLSVIRSCPDGTWSQVSWSPRLFPLPEDALDAWRVARFLNIPFVLFDSDELFRGIVDYFTESFYQGTTPNPCARCNRVLKFGRLMDAAFFLGADRFATGHYVRVVRQREWLLQEKERGGTVVPPWLADQPNELPLILRGNVDKDQSYVLFNVESSRLDRLVFPLGTTPKSETRQLARQWGIPVAERKDSQEVCFAENGRHLDFLERETEQRVTGGNFVSADGTVLGRHQGYHRYTVGQRKGLGIGFGQRTFVQRIDPITRNVFLGSHDDLATTTVAAVGGNWHVSIPWDREIGCEVKIRYRNRSTPALLVAHEDGTLLARLEQPVFGVAPGQALVAYWGDRLLGGGWLVPSLPERETSSDS